MENCKMKYTYTEALDQNGTLVGVNRSDGSFIPIDPANADYQAYLNKDNPEQTIGGNK
jgi:hypothetical protein